MKIKDLFEQLETSNKLHENFNDKTKFYLVVVFGEDSNGGRLYSYEDFLKYIWYEYIEVYCALAMTRELHSEQNYMYVKFTCNDEEEIIKFFLCEE